MARGDRLWLATTGFGPDVPPDQLKRHRSHQYIDPGFATAYMSAIFIVCEYSMRGKDEVFISNIIGGRLVDITSSVERGGAKSPGHSLAKI